MNLLGWLFQLMGPLFSAFALHRSRRPRLGSGLPYSVPRGTFRCADGKWAAISTSAESVASRVMALVGLGDDPRSRPSRAASSIATRSTSTWPTDRTARIVGRARSIRGRAHGGRAGARHGRHRRIIRTIGAGSIVDLDGVPMQGLIARLSATPGASDGPPAPWARTQRKSCANSINEPTVARLVPVSPPALRQPRCGPGAIRSPRPTRLAPERMQMVLLKSMRGVTGEPGPNRVAGMALAESPANPLDGPDTTVLGGVFEQHRKPTVIEAGHSCPLLGAWRRVPRPRRSDCTAEDGRRRCRSPLPSGPDRAAGAPAEPPTPASRSVAMKNCSLKSPVTGSVIGSTAGVDTPSARSLLDRLSSRLTAHRFRHLSPRLQRFCLEAGCPGRHLIAGHLLAGGAGGEQIMSHRHAAKSVGQVKRAQSSEQSTGAGDDAEPSLMFEQAGNRGKEPRVLSPRPAGRGDRSRLKHRPIQARESSSRSTGIAHYAQLHRWADDDACSSATESRPNANLWLTPGLRLDGPPRDRPART